MLPEERRNAIVSYIDNHKTASVQDLVDALDASAATIRRDLMTLHEENRIMKVFGGATSINYREAHVKEASVAEKAVLNTKEKDMIGKYAASLIEDDDFVYIDAGTTTLHLINHISNRNASYVTNGIAHAQKLLERGFTVMIIGGRLKPNTEAVIGPDHSDALSKFHFTKSFMGTNGISVSAGFTTPDLDEALIKREAIRHSHLSYILADNSKFGVVSAVSFSDLSDCYIITETTPDSRYTEQTIIKSASDK
jgi:DeoR family fructose operon transcriptional repressor